MTALNGMPTERDPGWRGGWLGLVARFPLTRIVLGALSVFGALVLTLALVGALREGLGFGPLRPVSLAFAISAALAAHLAYLGYVRFVEQRSAIELSWDGAPRELGQGALVGVGLLSGTVATLAAIGFYRVEAVNPWTVSIPAFALALQAAYVEEILYRGVLLRIVDESLGTWPALVISAALFGVVHLGTPNATLYTALAISLEAGLLLGAAYVLTRRLWLPIGIHFAWNFLQTGIFGGTRTAEALGARSLLDARLTGPDLLSGGGSGLDGSVFAVTLCLAVAAAFLVLAHRRGRFTPPFWRRERAA